VRSSRCISGHAGVKVLRRRVRRGRRAPRSQTRKSICCCGSPAGESARGAAIEDSRTARPAARAAGVPVIVGTQHLLAGTPIAAALAVGARTRRATRVATGAAPKAIHRRGSACGLEAWWRLNERPLNPNREQRPSWPLAPRALPGNRCALEVVETTVCRLVRASRSRPPVRRRFPAGVLRLHHPCRCGPSPDAAEKMKPSGAQFHAQDFGDLVSAACSLVCIQRRSSP